MPWYRTGTVAIAAGQTTVTGTGTNFSANARVGDALLGPDGNWYEVTNIASATVLSILPAYKGATVAGGTYAITPVQGYTKTLADKFNDIANTWGSTLAGLGAVSTENVLPVNKGGTGGTNQADARTGLGLKKAAVADIAGNVSQSGGVPTGAIIERGSNANGEYTKYADGTMECWMSIVVTDQAIDTVYAGGVYQGTRIWSFPAAFSGVPVVTPGSFRWGSAANWAALAGTPSGSTVTLRGFDMASRAVGTAVQISALAVGRWF
ncbi:conserved protein of unknown function [Pseudomonas sp. JV551A1]|uniref:Uncharacterized protein n=1 Tax=Pseudomonas inefficax TaxID=2078786 RepID=A0AAQ1PBL3_9PSED|nr:hypothetical protein [Pseudomonas sp. JV551A1]SPO56169.1 conserved protein of unknown function [Pseudomonas sp. JV551A1]SPO62266.1 conserved protein of unknown function [Pseudomonas inefficax]